mmetsp:Transcript_29576/g.78252  ORF Transcript_29576/g.78252 Transcript_29576/m.78252 type:complete len:302 (-) Transcript_29576:1003-1908(-)
MRDLSFASLCGHWKTILSSASLENPPTVPIRARLGEEEKRAVLCSEKRAVHCSVLPCVRALRTARILVMHQPPRKTSDQKFPIPVCWKRGGSRTSLLPMRRQECYRRIREIRSSTSTSRPFPRELSRDDEFGATVARTRALCPQSARTWRNSSRRRPRTAGRVVAAPLHDLQPSDCLSNLSSIVSKQGRGDAAWVQRHVPWLLRDSCSWPRRTSSKSKQNLNSAALKLPRKPRTSRRSLLASLRHVNVSGSETMSARTWLLSVMANDSNSIEPKKRRRRGHHWSRTRLPRSCQGALPSTHV